MSRPKVNKYAFDLFKWQEGVESRVLPVGTYFIECDHFPTSEDIDKAIYDEWAAYKNVKSGDTHQFFSDYGISQISIINQYKSCYFANSSKLRVINRNDNNIVLNLEYLNIRKIS